ncbi:hypothetical protein ICN84_03545 [Akkermansia glycaniphila]|uniref:HEAT repeat domain-containing protein n=1 Tax=Akkermansia glycaniphila TaxID=1679444 RepID=UPI001C030291|nr:HEAT repeat domain-containing protein [Akkermansia glycaniphila]MBT9449146.1 hypothetical protein [Akkermansia glycaniphila]
MRFLLPFLCIPFALAAELALPDDASQLSTVDRQELLAAWRNNAAACPREALVAQLSSPSLKTRCAALDLLEDLTGNDFGFDPWLPPSEIPAETRQALQDWSKSDAGFLNTSHPPDAEQINRAIAIFLSADDEMRERTCRLLLPHKNILIGAIEQTLKSRPDLTQDDIKALRQIEYRMQLDSTLGPKAAATSRLLVSDKRGDIIEGIESLRNSPQTVLPVLNTLIDHADPMVRETAIDVMLLTGKEKALEALMPMLQKETDPNILQIAFRRVTDYMNADMKKLLLRHALSPQEDVAVTALNVLRESKDIDDDMYSNVDSRSKKTRKEIRFSEEEMHRLLSSPNWRIRSALFELITADKRNRTTPKLTPESRQLIYKGMTDDDATVRQTAFQAIVVGKLFSNDLVPLCEELLKRDTEMLPQVIYLFMAVNADISETVQNMLSRMTVDQIENLLALEGDYTTYILASGSGNRATRTVVAALEKSPDPGVKRILLLRKSKGLMLRTDGWDAFLAGLENPAYTPAQKIELLESLNYVSLATLLDESAAPTESSSIYISSGTPPPASSARKQQFAPYMERLLGILRNMRDKDASDDLRHSALIALCSLRDKESRDTLIRTFPQMSASRKLSILETNDNVRLDLPAELFTQAFATGNEQIRKAVYSNLRYKRSSDTLDKYLTPEMCDAAMWHDSILWDWGSACRYSSANERRFFRSFLLAAVASDKVPMPLREEIAFYCCLDETTRKKPEVQNFIASCTSARKPYLQFIDDAPKKRGDILPWAVKWSKSPEPLIRFTVASCLQSLYDWKFVLPISANKKPLITEPAILRRKLSNSSSRTARAPEELVSLIRDMQKDTDGRVAAAAAISLLGITGDCDARLLKNQLEKINGIQEKRHLDEDDDSMTLEETLATMLQSQFTRITSTRNASSSDSSYFYSSEQVFTPLQGKLTDCEKDLFSFAAVLNPDYVKLKLENGEKLDIAGNGETAVSFTALTSPAGKETADGKTPEDAAENTPTPDIPVSAANETDEDDASDTPTGDIDTQKAIAIIFFEKPGCDECARTESELRDLAVTFPNIKVEKIVITTQNGLERNAALCRRFNVPGKERSIAPAVFTPNGYLTKADLNRDSLRHLIEQEARRKTDTTADNGETAGKLADVTQEERQQAQADIRRTYEDMTLGIVLLGGLIDGINPCAFATLIFFLSYLRIARRSPKELLWTGAAFILAIYLTYFSIGLAFNELIGVIQGAHVWKNVLDWTFAALALLAALLSFRDAWLARRGRMQDMSLKLPKFLRDRIHSVARTQAKASRYILAAFIAGIIISVLELACTGQVYAPIIYQIRAGHESAIAMLALYNFAFIAPLLLIFYLSYKGMSTQSLIRFQERHSFMVKLLLGILFLVLAAVILLTSLS